MAMKSYRDEPDNSGQKKLLIILGVLFVIFIFTGLVWPGFWR
ncbi:MAG: hypothetical protein ACTHM6_12010 [Tepidisphaeraceae bacterium]